MAREVIVTWSGPSMPGGMVSVLNFDETESVGLQRMDVNTFLTELGPVLHSSIQWRVENTGRVFDPVTGQTTGLWSDDFNASGQGNNEDSSPVANATMLLIQWRTGIYRNGREARGRTFIPGMTARLLAEGEVSESALGFARVAAGRMWAGQSGFSIWSRPKDGTPGTLSTVVGSSVWPELAVLRSRRG